ncbi:Cyclin-like F-box [Beauveria brongniartii RCEF 3172]|uniref:Cyclin-like F-box n=1 Tax=Beauveria brongniartii RCEF 3172 TaxID=1081107 RepID=A0A167A2R2_9HYPO|nr:Cyclin-like F-box [Beauveria brongniartii RCEF 3172]
MPTIESDLLPPPYESSLLKNKGADILVQNAYKNQIWSPLLRLPDKTLIVLMKSLDLDSLLRLRHTSRIFMWLFSSEASFKDYHLTPDKDEDKDRFQDTARIWTPPSLWFKNQAVSSLGRMCLECATKRKGDVLGKALLKSMPELHCSRCSTTHRVMHFSREQRLLPETDYRVCIGHEGYFVLCNHVNMTWQQVKSREHDRALPVLTCQNQEHIHPSLRCNIETCAEDESPSVTVHRDDDGLYMDFLHTRHILVKRLPSGKLCAESLRKALEQRPCGMSAAIWMPLLWPVAGNPLRIFDPNLCDCVEWRGSSLEAKQTRWPICPDPARPWRSAADDADLYVSTEPRCSQYSHSIFTVYTGADAEISIEGCEGRDDLLILVQRARYCISEACGSGWQDIVNSRSYGLANDKDMRGVTWCPNNQTCAVSNLLRSNKHLWNIESRDRIGPS